MRVGEVTEIIEAPGRHERGVSGLPIVERVDASHILFDEWLQLRQAFMERQGWTSGDDRDEYDLNSRTIQLLSLDNGVIEAGLRLTPQANIEDTMSWSWLPDELKTEAFANLPSAPNGVWDLTRLVPGRPTRDRAAASLMELFGAGYALTRQEQEAPLWVFATTESFFRYFRQEGVAFTPIVKGRFSPGDKFDSVLCYSDPADRTAYLRDSSNETYQKTYVSVARGMAAASLRGVMKG